jgi:hypothetical protein
MRHALIRSAFDHVAIALEQLNAEKPVVVRRLLLRRYAKPGVIWVELLGHAVLLG